MVFMVLNTESLKSKYSELVSLEGFEDKTVPWLFLMSSLEDYHSDLLFCYVASLLCMTVYLSLNLVGGHFNLTIFAKILFPNKFSC